MFDRSCAPCNSYLPADDFIDYATGEHVPGELVQDRADEDNLALERLDPGATAPVKPWVHRHAIAYFAASIMVATGAGIILPITVYFTPLIVLALFIILGSTNEETLEEGLERVGELATPAPMGEASDKPVSYSEAAQDRRVRERLWAQAQQRHQGLADVWAPIVADPLAVLDHSALLDPHNVLVNTFIEAYGAVGDLASALGDACPSSREDVNEYARLTRAAETAWRAALSHAEHTRYSWMPKADQDRARRAEGLLALAADTSHTMKARALYARKAAALLSALTSIAVPATAIETIEAPYRSLA